MHRDTIKFPQTDFINLSLSPSNKSLLFCSRIIASKKNSVSLNLVSSVDVVTAKDTAKTYVRLYLFQAMVS